MSTSVPGLTFDFLYLILYLFTYFRVLRYPVLGDIYIEIFTFNTLSRIPLLFHATNTHS